MADILQENEDSLDFKNSIIVCKCKEQVGVGFFLCLLFGVFLSLKEQSSSDNKAAPSPGVQASWKSGKAGDQRQKRQSIARFGAAGPILHRQRFFFEILNCDTKCMPISQQPSAFT